MFLRQAHIKITDLPATFLRLYLPALLVGFQLKKDGTPNLAFTVFLMQYQNAANGRFCCGAKCQWW